MSPEHRSEFESKFDEISHRLRAIEQRLVALEQSAAPIRPAPHSATDEDEEARPAPSPQRPETLPLIGRTLLVLAGAFLLRAVTESGTLPRATGALLGLLYALAWLVLGERAARKGQSHSANFHGLAASIIAFPLVWESTVNFGLISPPAAAAIVLGIALAGLAVASLRRLEAVGWLFVLGAVVTMLSLAFATKALVLFVSPVLLLGFVTLWLGYLRGWSSLGWVVAAVTNASVLLLGTMVLMGRAERVWEIVHPESVVTLQLALVLIYCGSLGARTLARRTEVVGAEIAQGSAALVVGLGGAVAVFETSGFGRGALGAVSVTLAASCYASAFAFIDQHTGGRRNFIFYTTLALVFSLVALDALLPRVAFSLAVSGLAVLAAWLGAARARATLTLHGAVYVTVAALGSGLIALIARAMAGSEPPAPEELTLESLVALVVAMVCAWLPVATHGRTWGTFSRVPKLVVLVVGTLGAGALLVILGAALLARGEGESVDLAGLAVLRTGVVAFMALGLAWASRFRLFVEARWLVYPVLVAGGVKLLVEDIAAGRPASLVLSFALYGGALIVAPRLARRGVDADTA